MLTVLYNLSIKPIELLLEIIFSVIYRLFSNSGLSIIFVSLAVQFLTLPLYKKSDAMQDKERHKQKDMEAWVSHIRKNFKGDERFMVLSTYYRQNNYKPIHALRGSVSLLLQVPFFIAAYNFLSGLSLLSGSSFYFISDLGKADGLLHIFGLTLNLLPILMTVINIMSGAIYTKGFTLKEKLQLYGMALIFLVLLYDCPSGLVLYWTLNNLFSLFKNIFVKIIKNPKKILSFCISVFGVFSFFYMLRGGYLHSAIRAALCVAVAVLAQLPLVLCFVKFKSSEIKVIDSKVFVLGGLFLATLIGLVIPYSVITPSPTEFISANYGPLFLIVSTFSIALGLFCVWFNVFYFMVSDRAKNVFSYSMVILIGICLVDYLFFGRKLGNVSPYLTFDAELFFSQKDKLLNVLLILLVCSLLVLTLKFKTSLIKPLLTVLIISGLALSLFDTFKVVKSLKEIPENVSSSEDTSKPIQLSKEGKNVVVLMLDRAISGYIPFILEEKPELKEAFRGFTYYPNTLSYGRTTNHGTPVLFGGYEYTPLEINKRKDEFLASKHNEALKVMPKLFSDNGFDVSVCDPPYAGYKWDSDLSIYDDLKNVRAQITMGAYTGKLGDLFAERYESEQKRDFFWYGIMKCLPVVLQNFIYDDGFYYSANITGLGHAFLASYTTLMSMTEMTSISESDKNNLLLFTNNMTHDVGFLKTPEYELSIDLKKEEIDRENRVLSDGSILWLGNDYNVKHYQSNVAAYLGLEKWFDYLKENGVWDNTRIILVADHGNSLGQFGYMNLSNGVDVETFNPLLMVKDFDSDFDMVTDNSFMTIGAVPTLAASGLIEDAVNPYTGKKLLDGEFPTQAIITTTPNNSVEGNYRNTFDLSDGTCYEIKDNIFDVNNWSVYKYED